MVFPKILQHLDERSITAIIHPKTLEQEAALDALLLKIIEELVEKTPNDQDLGKEIREIFTNKGFAN